MANRIDVNWANIEAMYIFSSEKLSIADIVKQCKAQGLQISQGTIGNKARDENWVQKREDYWKKVNKNVERRLTTQITKRRMNNVKIVDATVNLGAKNLLNKLKNDPDFVLSAGDLDKLMRLQEFLLGYSDSRQEKRISINKPISELTDEELEKAQNKILDADFEVEESETIEGKADQSE